MVLKDIGRIEVIRGPGATVRDANPVNGTINTITKSTNDTEDGLISLVIDQPGLAIRQNG
ncbi:MAG: hypothetical protein KZQ84_00390 [Candidatus Thiodiazotropha sp. (ex Lucinoma borealis)]|nr:hypothetical protein [Candidatus Thiodiazotropha sp. (ex Lucinoma borealis)]